MLTPVPPNYLRNSLISHAQKVCKLYKVALYDCKAKYPLKYQYCILRARFEENRSVTDEVLAKKILDNGWKEYIQTKSSTPFIYPDAPGGVAYERNDYIPDSRFDLWHPLEKARFPDYFARREQRKKEFMERWVKRYGEPNDENLLK